jgi:hypothetical protein
MQGDDCTRESHQENSGAEDTESVHGALFKVAQSPVDERGHPGALEQECEGYQNARCTGLRDTGRSLPSRHIVILFGTGGFFLSAIQLALCRNLNFLQPLSCGLIEILVVRKCPIQRIPLPKLPGRDA